MGLGPIGALARIEGSWDGLFGGEIVFADINERRLVSALAVAAGAVQFTERGGGRLWLDVMAGVKTPLGGVIGLAVGPVVELDDVRIPRWGGQATLWLYAGVVPFVRVGRVKTSGIFVDIGLKIVLPTYRW